MPKTELYTTYKVFGGYDFSERQMVAFLPDALYYDYGYPMQALKICPVNKRFAEDLTHRDYLGAIMNLGTSRTKIGDIIQTDDGAIVFVKEEISDYIMEYLKENKTDTDGGAIY